MKIKTLGVVALGAAFLAFAANANAEENDDAWFEYQENPVVVEEEKINEVAPAPCEAVAPLAPKIEARRTLTWRVVSPREWIRVEKDCDVCEPGLTLDEPVEPCGPAERNLERRRLRFCERLSFFKRSVCRNVEVSVATSRFD